MSAIRGIAGLDAPAARKVADFESDSGAGSETRTRTMSPPVDFESTASTNSAIPAVRVASIRPAAPCRPRTAGLAAWAPGDDNPADELLPELRRAGRLARAGRRPPAPQCLRCLRADPLRQPQADHRLRARARGPDPAVPARDRAAARLLDLSGRLHGDRRDAAAGRGARMPGRGARAGRNRGAVRDRARAVERAGARDVPRAAPGSVIRRGTREPRGAPVHGGRGPVAL